MVRPLLFFCSLFKNLTPQVAGDITDMEPPAIAFPDELGEADLSCLLHLYDELEQAAVVGPVSGDDIGSTAEEMVTVLGSAHEGVELLAAVARGDHDGLAPRLAYGVQELVYEYVQQVVGTLVRAVVDALTQRRGAAC